MVFTYKVSDANQYIVKTGAGIKDIELVKKGWVWPGQHATLFDVTPQNFSLELHAMTIEKLEFLLPAVFTIGPKLDEASLHKYARLLAGSENKTHAMTELVKGVIEGETRVIAAAMSMEEIFKERRTFKDMVVRNVQSELDHFGVFIYNANIKSLQDTAGSEYFSYLRQKTQEGAVNQAKIDVAAARNRGDVGAKEKEGLTRQNVQRIEADTLIYERQKEAEILKAQAELDEKQAQYDRDVKLAQIEAQQATQVREMELKRQVEEKRQLAETERLRASIVAKSKAEYEVSVQKANAELYNQERIAEAEFFQKQKDAEAALAAVSLDGEGQCKLADASLYRETKRAEAEMIRKQKEAETIKIMADAHYYQAQKEADGLSSTMIAKAQGIAAIVDAFKGDSAAAMQYLMLEKGVMQDLAKTNAEAIRGLNPKITVWNTGDTNQAQNPIADIYKSLPPLLSTIQEQCGITPPSWAINMPPTEANDPPRKS
ncbi:hypothetical protein DFQ28_010172 [Apophysomyces sp. BC1034]|nr:hypothetical protein DFQ30_010065 [Apophysomyces sp. BC1015]KAG0181555.1 hypothetical protein DFQ29_008019 [Apophysomyces sp. BC1021]KAG0192083.1 hypothetical protein DFQ28_010172 [Apophysomyces sp. BC1034]